MGTRLFFCFFPERRAIGQPVEIVPDILYLPLQEGANGGCEFRRCDPVSRPGVDGQEARRKLGRPLGAALEYFEAPLNAEFDGLVVTGLEMKSGNKFGSSPIAPVERL